MKTFRYVAMLSCAMALSACDKNAVQDITSSPPGASIKFFNFGLGSPGVNFYAGTTKLTAISSTTGVEAVTGVAYTAAGNGGFYSGVAPGTYELSGKIATATDKDLAISKVSTTLADGKYYSYYQSGVYSTATKSVDAFVVEDPFVSKIDYTVAYVRFVNAISNSAPMTLYVKNTTTATELPVGAAVTYKSAGAFTAIPSGVYDLGARLTGVATNAISRTAVSFVAGRVYTISSRGDITVTTGTNVPFLDNTANR
ncbi:MAG: hypothetical protein V4550_15585 [Gemmatimonadota bacterium]